jgi:hypothetical protein
MLEEILVACQAHGLIKKAVPSASAVGSPSIEPTLRVRPAATWPVGLEAGPEGSQDAAGNHAPGLKSQKEITKHLVPNKGSNC